MTGTARMLFVEDMISSLRQNPSEVFDVIIRTQAEGAWQITSTRLGHYTHCDKKHTLSWHSAALLRPS